jgi:hypothetical protein
MKGYYKLLKVSLYTMSQASTVSLQYFTIKRVTLTFTITNKALFSLQRFTTQHEILVWQVQTGNQDHSK